MYKAVFSDFDGTLLNSEHQITPKTLAAIQRIGEKGVPFVPISARSPKGIWPYAKQIGNLPVIVAFSGALILDAQGQTLFSSEIAEADVARASEILGDYDLAVNYYFYDDCFANDVENYWVKYEMSVTKIVILQAEAGKIYPAHKIQVIGEPEVILAAENALKAALPHLSIHRSLARFLEVMAPTASKGQAVQFLEKHFGVTTSEVIAFGDNFNDLDMLKHAGLGVAMDNAPQEIKDAANRVTASHNEDGIALVLNEVFA